MNRHDRRAEKAKAKARGPAFQKVVPLEGDIKKQLMELILSPDYKADIERLAKAMYLWQKLHPEEKPEWQDTTTVLLAGGSLDDERARGFVAGNDAAHRCLLWADEHTGRQLSMLQAQCALWVLGWA